MYLNLSKAGWVTTALTLFACVLSQSVNAQEVRSAMAGGSGAQVNGRPAPMDASATVSPELEKILQTWEQKSGQVNRMKGEFTRIEYDQIFTTAKCAVGKYWFENPDKGRMDFMPDPNANATPARQVTRGDKTYSVQAAEAHSWICDGEQILAIDLVKKEYNRIRIPEHYRGTKISDGPLPFLFGMQAAKIKERYILELGSLHNPQKIIHIVAYPKMPAEQREYRVAEVLLDPVEYLPKAIQLQDPTGNKQTVYVFTKHDQVTLPFLPPPGPFRPHMIGYKVILDEESTSSQDREAKKEGILIR